MSKRYPSNEKALIVLCEDVRKEAGNKVSLMGVFIGGNIVLPKGTALPAAVSSVALFAVFNDGEGTFKQSIEVVAPNKAAESQEAPDATKLAGQPLTFLVLFKPFLVESFGVYTFRIKLDDQIYERQIPVVEDSSPAA